MWSREICHCGGQVYVHDLNGERFTRGLCQSCDEERCDAPQEGVRYSCEHSWRHGIDMRYVGLGDEL